MNAPAKVKTVPFFRHGLGRADADCIARVLDSSILTSGAVGREVERELCEYFAISHAKLTNSWTNGAVATLLALGIGRGDEVIVPAMTFVATANVVELVGARPVLVDVREVDLLLDLEAVAAAITERTRAVIPVHLYGQMVDVAALRAVVGPDIAIIEDAAHCFEGRIGNQRPGEHSDAAIFSFYATKNITCGEGGAIITRSEEIAAAIGRTVLHGMSAGAADRFSGKVYRHWDMEQLGTKANLPDLLAALLPNQIATVDERRSERGRLADRYRAVFSACRDIRLVKQAPDRLSAEHLLPIGAPEGRRDEVLTKLNNAGVGATVNYRAVHCTGYYKRKYGFAPDDFPVARAWGEATLSLPLFPGLRTDEQDYVIAATLEIVGALAPVQGA